MEKLLELKENKKLVEFKHKGDWTVDLIDDAFKEVVLMAGTSLVVPPPISLYVKN